MLKRQIAAIALTAISLSACGLNPHKGLPKTSDTAFTSPEVGLIEASHHSVDAMLSQKPPIGGPILVTSIMNIGDANTSNSVGQIVSEQMTSRLAQRGYTVVEAQISDKTYDVRQDGTFMLTPKTAEIASEHNASSALVGTFGYTQGKLYISARLIDIGTGTVLAADDFTAGDGSSETQQTVIVDRYGDGATIINKDNGGSSRRRITN